MNRRRFKTLGLIAAVTAGFSYYGYWCGYYLGHPAKQTLAHDVMSFVAMFAYTCFCGRLVYLLIAYAVPMWLEEHGIVIGQRDNKKEGEGE